MRVLVSQPVSLFDVPLDIRVTGLATGQRVTVRLAAAGSGGSSQATFLARGPVVDLATMAPVSGSYRGADGMGLFESLAGGQPVSSMAIRQRFTLAATAFGERAPVVSLTRDLVGPGVRCSSRTIEDDGFYGMYCAPAPHTGRRPPVLVLGGSEGGDALIPMAELLASRGYPALALAYFAEPGLPAALDRIPLEYFARAISWLDGQPGVDAGELAVFGVSYGSEAALLLANYFPGLVHAVIAGSPSSVISGAVSLTQPVSHRDPAWTLSGRPLPIGALIPVGGIQGPVLLLAGADDQLWPSPAYAQQIMQELDADRDGYTHQDQVFPGAGHLAGSAFPYDIGSTTDGGTPYVNAAAATAAWQDILAFLRTLSS